MGRLDDAKSSIRYPASVDRQRERSGMYDFHPRARVCDDSEICFGASKRGRLSADASKDLAIIAFVSGEHCPLRCLLDQWLGSPIGLGTPRRLTAAATHERKISAATGQCLLKTCRGNRQTVCRVRSKTRSELLDGRRKAYNTISRSIWSSKGVLAGNSNANLAPPSTDSLSARIYPLCASMID